jgi:hypothetical protein
LVHKTLKAGLDCLGTAFNQRRSEMRKIILGALLVIVSTVHMAGATEHHGRRGHDLWDFRGSYNQLYEPHRSVENFGFGTGGRGGSFLHPGDIKPSGS